MGEQPTLGNHLKTTWGERKWRFGGLRIQARGPNKYCGLRVKEKKIYEASHEALASAPTHFSGLQSGPLLLKRLLWQLSCGPEETCLVMHM